MIYSRELVVILLLLLICYFKELLDYVYKYFIKITTVLVLSLLDGRTSSTVSYTHLSVGFDAYKRASLMIRLG